MSTPDIRPGIPFALGAALAEQRRARVHRRVEHRAPDLRHWGQRGASHDKRRCRTRGARSRTPRTATPCALPRSARLPVPVTIAEQYFDVGQSRSLPWKRRPEVSRVPADVGPRSGPGDPGRGHRLGRAGSVVLHPGDRRGVTHEGSGRHRRHPRTRDDDEYAHRRDRIPARIPENSAHWRHRTRSGWYPQEDRHARQSIVRIRSR